jgi:hypothetical protein
MSSAYSCYFYVSEPAKHDLDPLADSCCICYHPYNPTLMNPEAEEPVQLACGHVFGISCLEKWIRSNGTCPLCRADLNIQNTPDEAMDAFSYVEYVSWQSVETDADGKSEAEYFDANEEFETPCHAQYRPDEDLWIATAYDEELYSLYTPLKPYFSSAIDTFDIALDERFKELIDCHEQWMGDILGYEEHDEHAIGLYDVFL